MKTKTFLAFLTFVFMVHCTTNNTRQQPPLAQVKPVEDVYFGTRITDPYRYMENLKDSTVQQWFKAQADYSRNILNSIPGRQKLIDKMIEFDGRKSSRIQLFEISENNTYLYLKTTPADQTGKLFYRDGYEGKETLLYDPEKHGSDTTLKYSISSASLSIDGSKVAFQIAPNGSESCEMVIMDIKDQKKYPEKFDRCMFGCSWNSDGSGLFYVQMKSSDVHQKDRLLDSKSLLHSIGTNPSTDKIILSKQKYPQLGFSSEAIPFVIYDKDSKNLFGYVSTVDNRQTIFYAPYSELKKDNINWKPLFKQEDEVYGFQTTNTDLYIYTPKGAPRFKLLKTSVQNPDLEKAEVVIPEDKNGTIESFAITSEGLYYTLSENGVTARLFFKANGEKSAKEIKLPFAAGTASVNGRSFKFSDVWVNISGWSSANQRYRYLSQKNEFALENLSSVAEYPEFKDLVVEELMIPSHDGVKVPLSLVYNKGIKKDGNNSVLFFGYGAYGISMNPFFSPAFLLWTSNGGIFAVPHVRGGGELGDQWHKAGFKTTKPNTWKDLIACAEYLVAEKYTSPKKIAIYSASAGGILIGRAMTERPDLFAAAIPYFGCLNAVRMEEEPSGPNNIPEFGTVKDSVEFKALLEMDSYHHIKTGEKFPAALITAGMNDPRVIAWQPGKFAARLQAANGSDKPILFLTDFAAGHGIGNTKTKDFENLADILSFAFWQTGHPVYQLK